MQLLVTVNSENMLRIADGEGAALTFRLKKDVAQVLSVSVPSELQRCGRGKALLRASERLLALKGIKRVYADFVERVGDVMADGGVEDAAGAGDVAGVKGFDAVRPMLMGAGYAVDGEVDIYALPTAMVLYDPHVKRALETDAHGRYFVSLSDLSVAQMSSVMRFLESIRADISCYDMAHFEDRISGAVCDGGGDPIAMILCSHNGDDLHVDALISKAVSDSGAGLVAILGMISALKAAGGEFAYSRVTMAGYNNKLTSLIRRTLSSGAELEVIGKCVTMRKEIGKGSSGVDAVSGGGSGSVPGGGGNSSAGADADFGGGEKIEYKAARDDFMESAWERDLIKFPLQKNVTWKGPWYRG